MLLGEMFGIDKKVTRACGHYLEIPEASFGLLLLDSFLYYFLNAYKRCPNVITVSKRQERKEY